MNDAFPALPAVPARIIRVQCCSTCKHSNRNDQANLECRESPPAVQTFMVPGPQGPGGPPGFLVHTSFPIVREEFWCGKFTTRIAT